MLRLEIQPYLDKFSLVEPNINTPSNNGVMYTSEYLVALIRNKEAQDQDCQAYLKTLGTCTPTPGLLQRAPDNSGGQEGPDDYYGVMAALDEIQNSSVASDSTKLMARAVANQVVYYAESHWGSMDNVVPGAFQWTAVLGRQLQLDAATLWAAGRFVGPFLRLWTAIVILFSSKGQPTDTTDPRRLSWLLVQVASRHSWICRMASKVWYNRLYAAYPNGMKGVNSIYFQPTHPLAIYVVDKA